MRETVQPATHDRIVDSHIHLFESRHRGAWVPWRTYDPPVASASAYLAVARHWRVTHAVIVQPSVYGANNTPLMDLLREHPSWRGVAVLSAASGESEVDTLHRCGVRGVRLNLVQPSGMGVSDLRGLVPAMAERGWHVQLVGRCEDLVPALRELVQLELPIVVDHFGWPEPAQGVGAAPFQALLSTVRNHPCWVKLSGPYRFSRSPGSLYEDMVPFAQGLVHAAPDRILWGSDWPHPDVAGHVVDSRELMRVLALWVPDAKRRADILWNNPRRLYGWPETG